MNQSDLEATYAAIAHKIDEIGEDQSELFLAKLALLLAYKAGKLDEILDCIDEAGTSLIE